MDNDKGGLRRAEQAAMEAMTGKQGWTYHDLPRLPISEFERFIEIIGAENIHWITVAHYPAKGDVPALKRGQIMISPAGKQRGDTYANNLKGATDGQ